MVVQMIFWMKEDRAFGEQSQNLEMRPNGPPAGNRTKFFFLGSVKK